MNVFVIKTSVLKTASMLIYFSVPHRTLAVALLSESRTVQNAVLTRKTALQPDQMLPVAQQKTLM